MAGGRKFNKINEREIKGSLAKVVLFWEFDLSFLSFCPAPNVRLLKRKKSIILKVFKINGCQLLLRKYYFALMIAEFRIKSDHHKFLKKTIMSRLLWKKESHILKVFFKEIVTNIYFENIITMGRWSPNFALKLTTEFSWNEPSWFVFKTDH